MSVTEFATLTDGTQRYQQRVSLDGTEYFVTFAYSLRRDRWTFSLQGLDSTDILTGETVHPNIQLNRRAVGGPPGVLMAIPISGFVGAPGLHDLGEGVKLFYISADDPLLTGEDA